MKRMLRLAGVAFWGLLMLSLLAACGPAIAKPVAPAGAALGQATFLYFYTDG